MNWAKRIKIYSNTSNENASLVHCLSLITTYKALKYSAWFWGVILAIHQKSFQCKKLFNVLWGRMNNCPLFLFSISFMIWKPSRIPNGSDVCSAHLVLNISSFQTPLVFLLSILSCSLVAFFREDDHKWGLQAGTPQSAITKIKKCHYFIPQHFPHYS